MAGKTHKEVLKRALAEKKIRNEYEALEPEFELRRALICLRRDMNITQKELAEMINTKQEYVSRIECGHVEVSVPYLARLVKAMGADMEIIFKPKEGGEPIRTFIGVK